jgi:uncharacterized membrane protein
MSKGKGWGIAALVVGILLIGSGLLVKFVVFPSQAKFPDDVDSARQYDGDLAVIMNAAALETGDFANLFLRDVPVTIDRQIKTAEVGGDDGAIVTDEVVMSGPQGPLAASLDVYAIDRTTMDAIANFSDDDRVIDRVGLVVGWPIGSEPVDYTGWNGDTHETVVLAYQGEEERGGLDTYKYHAVSDHQLIVDEATLAGFPAALPKELLVQIAPMLGLPDEAVAQLGALLPNLPEEVPLAYTYAFDKTYWVEPSTGVLIDIEVQESRATALAIPGQEPMAIAEVQNLTYTATDGSVQDAVDDANSGIATINLFDLYLPWGLVIIGVILAIIGIVLLVRKPKEQATPEPTATA